MEQRNYRHWIESGNLVSFSVTVEETDLYIRAAGNLKRKAERLVVKYRSQLVKYIEKNPQFKASLEPLPIPATAPLIVKRMCAAAIAAEVGPMAAVAGAVSEFVGMELLEFSPEVIIENGGDIFMKSASPRVVGIYAGKSSLSGNIGIEIAAKDTPMGICTSSGTVGHSLSFGRADAVAVLSGSATLADAAATAIGNRVKSADDIDQAIEFARNIEGLRGVLIIIEDKVGVWGDVNICPTSA